MKTASKLLTVAALALLTCVPQPARATVLNFDDLPNPGDTAPAVPDGYGGILWSSGGWSYFAEEQFPYTAHSGSARAFSYSLDNRFFFSGADVVFGGAWFSGGSSYDDGTPTNDELKLDLYWHGTLVAQSSTLKISATPTFLASGYLGPVDAVGITETVVRPENTDFVMDDVAFTAVPEPSTFGPILLTLLAPVTLRLRTSFTAR